jgi:hypothetical protein
VFMGLERFITEKVVEMRRARGLAVDVSFHIVTISLKITGKLH